MVAVLGPGMKAVRRLGISGKFTAVGLLLVLPLGVNVAAGWGGASTQLSLAARERQGLALATPLVRLTARLAAVEGGDGDASTPALMGSVSELDAVAGQDARWTPLRAEVLQVTAARGTGTAASAAAQARSRATGLLGATAGGSGLVLDPQAGSHDAVTALVEVLPELLDQAVACGTARSGAGSASGGVPVCRDGLQQAADRLHSAVAGAAAASAAGLGSEVGPALRILSAAVAGYAAAPPAPPGQGPALHEVTAAAASVATALGGSVDTLLSARQGQLARSRLRPLALTLLALLAAGYMMAALYRATVHDVRTVLEDINTVTNGALNQTPPLPGRDEFAQMSRAVVHARDRLTALLGALRFRATHDELTSLGNRTLLMEKLQETLAEGRGPVAVLLIDLRRFTDVNDSFGHDIGDQVLRTAGARLHRGAGRRNVVARTGANEFGVLVTDIGGSADLRRLIERLRTALEEPVDIDGRQLRTRVVIGAAVGGGDPGAGDSEAGDPGAGDLGAGDPRAGDSGGGDRPDARDLLRRAAVALSAVKADHDTGTAFYAPAMQHATRERTELSADLVTALDGGQLSVVYQPIVDLGGGTLYGVEALVRWVHPTRGPISPEVFVPLAEATGLIVPLGRWVLREAVLQLAGWHRDFPAAGPLVLDVNLSADQLADAELPGRLLSLINATGLDPGQLVLEITESALVRNLASARQRLGQLSATGVRLALDDFGTGYSSLSYLRDLPVGVLKVDKSFMEGIEDTTGTAGRLLHSIVDLGAGLGMELIAEGIESPAQLDALRRCGCHLGQGYLWSRPLPADEVADLLRSGDSRALPVRAGAELAAVGSARRPGAGPGSRGRALPPPQPGPRAPDHRRDA